MKEEMLKEFGPWAFLFEKDDQFWQLLETPIKALAEMFKSKRKITPPGVQVFRAFRSVPPEKLKVVIVGQDPYPDEGVADGLAFSTQLLARPQSLYNIVEAVVKDYGKQRGSFRYFFGNSLKQWADQGVMLLNARLTCDIGHPASHKIGWEEWMAHVLDRIAQHQVNTYQSTVFLLWGSLAQNTGKGLFHYMPLYHLILKHAHPANREGEFESCDHFSKTNSFLNGVNRGGINWLLFEDLYECMHLELRHAEDNGYPIRYMPVATPWIGFINEYVNPGKPIKFDPVKHHNYCKRLALFETKQYRYLDFKDLAKRMDAFSADTVAGTYLMLTSNKQYPALLSGQKQ